MSNGVIRRAGALLVGSLVAITLTAAPASAKTTEPEKWGAAFCGSLSDWGDDVSTGATEIQRSLSGTTLTPDQGKTTIIRYLGDIADTTTGFYQRMKRAGTPDAPNGAKIQKTILLGIKGIETNLAGMQDLARTLPTTDATSFQTSVQALTAAFATVSTPFDQAMDTVASLDRDEALIGRLQKVKACKVLFG